MYKNGGVSQIKPATKQPEWITKSLKYHGETEKTTPNVQNVQPDIKHMALKRMESDHQICGSARGGQELNLFRHRGSDLFHPVMQSWGLAEKQEIRSFSQKGRNQIFMLLKFMRRADMVTLCCHKCVCGRDHGMVKWLHVQPWSVGRQEGRRISTCQYTYSPSQADAG